MTETVIAYLGIGSNLDNPLAQVTRALRELDAIPGIRVQRVSPWFGSTAVGPGPQPDYVNGAVEIETTLEPLALLRALQQLEQLHGRIRNQRWGARTLDLDILFYGEQHIDLPDLQVPHPRLAERAFVLTPLARLCPERRLPSPSAGKSETIASLSGRLPIHDVWQLDTGTGTL